MNNGDIVDTIVEEMRKLGCVVESKNGHLIKMIGGNEISIIGNKIQTGYEIIDISDPDFDPVKFCIDQYNKGLNDIRNEEGYILLVVMLAVLVNVGLALYLFQQPYCLFALIPIITCFRFGWRYIKAMLFKIIAIPYRLRK